jgi:hypothetical protein
MGTRFSVELDLAAVEKLLGGSSELEIKLRNGVVTHFVQGHLKSLLPSVVQEEIRGSIVAAIRAQSASIIEGYFDETDYERRLTLSQKALQLVKTAVADAGGIKYVEDAIAKAVKERVNEQMAILERTVLPMVERAVSVGTKRIIDEAVAKRLAAISQLASLTAEQG